LNWGNVEPSEAFALSAIWSSDFTLHVIISRFTIQRFTIQRFTIQRFTIQRFTIQRFTIQRFTIHDSRFNASTIAKVSSPATRPATILPP